MKYAGMYILNERGDEKMRKDLPRLAFDEIPQELPDAKEITKIIKHGNTVIGYEIASEFSVTKEEAITLAKEGKIRNVGIAHRNGEQYLKSLPDGDWNNNLSSLPIENEKKS